MMAQRDVTHLVEDALLECHSVEAMRDILRRLPELPTELRQADRRELDECVLELLGVTDKSQRQELLSVLYHETTKYYRQQRTLEIQGMENRSGKKSRRFSPQDLAEGIWSSLADSEKSPKILDWMGLSYGDMMTVEIPEGKPEALGSTDMFNPNAVIFRRDKKAHQVSYASPEQAALIVELSKLGIDGAIGVPKDSTSCKQCLEQLLTRLTTARERFGQLVSSRTGTQSLQDKTVDLLLRWYIHGKAGDR